LSRFDLLFILLDTVDLESDRKISDHVVRVHRYRSPREVDGEVTIVNTGADDLSTATRKDQKDQKETVVWDKHDNLLHGGQKPKRGSERLLNLDFLKKYIEVAKCIKPSLTEEACEMIGEEYARLRSQVFNNDIFFAI
jgi:DNA replication licensing factor MCM3